MQDSDNRLSDLYLGEFEGLWVPNPEVSKKAIIFLQLDSQ